MRRVSIRQLVMISAIVTSLRYLLGMEHDTKPELLTLAGEKNNSGRSGSTVVDLETVNAPRDTKLQQLSTERLPTH
jgi:hypothetical protein